MKLCVAYWVNGQIAQISTVPPNNDVSGDGPSGTLKLLVDDFPYDINSVYVDNGSIVKMPVKPSDWHDFDYGAKKWVGNADRAWQFVRYKRNNLLSESDWTDTNSAIDRLGQEVYNSWQAYRQALRDVTSQSDPFNIIWPQKSDFM